MIARRKFSRPAPSACAAAMLGAPGMVDAVAENIVDFDGVRGGAVDQRHRARIAALELFRKGLLQHRSRRDGQARVERRMPIDQRAPRVVRDFRWDRLRTPAHRPIRPTFDDMHDRANVPFGNTGGANDAVDRWVVLGLCVRFGGGAGISEPAGSHRRAVAAGGQRRHTARTVAPAFGEALGQQVIVENRAGAGGRIGTRSGGEVGARRLHAAPRLERHRHRRTRGMEEPRLRSAQGFLAVGPIQSVPIVLTVAPKTPLASYANTQPAPKRTQVSHHRLGRQRLVEPPRHRASHAAGESQAAPHAIKGSGPALTDLIGSQVQSMMDQLTASIGHIREGRIRALAISSAKRSPLLPNVPTLESSA